jgi:hypothetical protein
VTDTAANDAADASAFSAADAAANSTADAATLRALRGFSPQTTAADSAARHLAHSCQSGLVCV